MFYSTDNIEQIQKMLRLQKIKAIAEITNDRILSELDKYKRVLQIVKLE